MKTLLYVLSILLTPSLMAQTATWQKIVTPTTKDLNCIVFSSPLVGYIGGADSVLLKTIDGGLTWNIVNFSGINFAAGGDDFLELDFVTNDIGFATVGPYSGTYRTADGGLTWTQLSTSSTLCYNHGLYFFADGEGFIGGAGCFQGEQMDRFVSGISNPVNIHSPSWQSSDLIVDIDFDLNVFASVGLAVSHGGRILRTSDGGANWDTIQSPLGNLVPLTSVSIVNSNLAYVGYDDGNGIGGLLMSTDGGLTWSFDLNSANFYYPIFHDLYTTPSARTYVGATSTTLNSGLIMESTGSNFWNLYPVDEPIYSMSSYNDTILWGAGKNGYLVRKSSSNPLSLTSMTANEDIKLFPNPAVDIVTIHCPDHLKNEPLRIELHSMDGKLVKVAEGRNKQILLSELQRGVYRVSVKTAMQEWITNIVKY